MKKVVLGAAMAVTLAGQANALETPTPVAIGDDVVYEGTLRGSEVDRYSLRMKSGQVFAFGGRTSDACVLVELLDSSGRILKSACDGIGSFGFDFLSPVDATYRLRLRRSPLNSEVEDFSYNFTLQPDCISDTRSRCGQKLGVLVSRVLSWHSDEDYIRVPVTRGRTYTFEMIWEDIAGHGRLELRNRDNAVIAADYDEIDPARIVWKAPRDMVVFMNSRAPSDWDRPSSYTTKITRR
jgi:hypothetical protein